MKKAFFWSFIIAALAACNQDKKDAFQELSADWERTNTEAQEMARTLANSFTSLASARSMVDSVAGEQGEQMSENMLNKITDLQTRMNDANNSLIEVVQEIKKVLTPMENTKVTYESLKSALENQSKIPGDAVSTLRDSLGFVKPALKQVTSRMNKIRDDISDIYNDARALRQNSN